MMDNFMEILLAIFTSTIPTPLVFVLLFVVYVLTNTRRYTSMCKMMFHKGQKSGFEMGYKRGLEK